MIKSFLQFTLFFNLSHLKKQLLYVNCVKSVPIQGIADSILVITVAKLSNHIR